MNPENWSRTEELFHEAIGLSTEERAVYLAQACHQDAPLRAEVEALIAAFENRNEFMKQSAFSLGMKLMSEESKDEALVGREIGPYKILALIGKGGMGEVYLAEDSRLARKVALKFLSHKVTDDAWAKRQLMKEAQAIAMLDHPNICAVHGFEEYDGYNFMVMQYVEGETLGSLISKKLLKPIQIPRLAIQIVSALAEAHSHSIIHRDIKPSNIMVTESGQAKVLDFGLAKLVQHRQDALAAGDSESYSSQFGLVLGTVAYMSPEQLRAEKLDFRSDIFSFGIVLYEMISGKNPYSQRSNAEIISAILTSDPQPLTKLAAGIPQGLAQIAEKCLKRDRKERYQSASEMLIDLDDPSKEVTIRSYWRTQFNLRTLVTLALLLLMIGVSYVYLHQPRARTLAVLPILNNGKNPSTEFLSEGLTEGLASRLSRLPELRIKAPTVIPEYESEVEARQKAGSDFNVDAVLFGTLTPQNGLLILQVMLVNAEDGSPIWQEEFSLESAELLRLQDDLAYQIAFRLQPSISKDARQLLAARQTQNSDAYRLYLTGRHLLRVRDRDTIQQAINDFNQAIKLDPLYAQARAGLADCYVLLNSLPYGSVPTKETMEKAQAAAKDAIEIDDSLCEAHTSLGVIKLRYDWNWQEAEREFVRAISLNPNYALAHFWYSQLLALIGRPGEAIRESEIAKQLDPFSPLSEMNLARVFYWAGQYDRALDLSLKMLESDPANTNALYMLGVLYQQKGLIKKSVDALEKLHSLKPDLAAGPLGYVYAKFGRKEDAWKMLDELEEIRKQKYVSAQEIAIIYMGLDDKDKAFLFFDKACREERSASLPFIKIDPLFDSIRSDPRYNDLARCANIFK